MDETSSINVVQLDGLVLLKIIKHCKQNVPEVVTGQLLGLDVDDRLEVTDCFPMPSDEHADDSYQLQMLKNLREINVDNNTVGWYQSAFMGSFFDQSNIDSQFHFQKAVPNSVVVVYDPLKSTNGSLSLQAYRLSDKFMQLYQTHDFTAARFAQMEISPSDIFEEVAIKIHNSHLAHGFLYEMRESKTMDCNADRLSVGTHPFLLKNLGYMSDCIDDLVTEQIKFQIAHRHNSKIEKSRSERQAENEQRLKDGKPLLPEDDIKGNTKASSRLETFLILNQIGYHCRQTKATCNLAFNKLYTAEALHDNASEDASL